jgi:hypothetical protein
MTTAVHTQALGMRGSWPFPAASQFRKSATAPSSPTSSVGEEGEAQDDHVDHAEQELVREQKERDRNASNAVDPNKKDRPTA